MEVFRFVIHQFPPVRKPSNKLKDCLNNITNTINHENSSSRHITFVHK